MNEIVKSNDRELLDEGSVKEEIGQALLGMAKDESLRVRGNLNSLSALESMALEMSLEKLANGEMSIYELTRLIKTMDTSVNRSVNLMKIATELGDMMNVVINNTTYNTQNNTVNVSSELDGLDKESREKIRKFLNAATIMEDEQND